MNDKYQEINLKDLENVTGGANWYSWDYERKADMELNLVQPESTSSYDAKSLMENCPKNPVMDGKESKC